MDIEGYECKALQPEVLLGKTGKIIPYIFLEWMALVRAVSETNLNHDCLGRSREERRVCVRSTTGGDTSSGPEATPPILRVRDRISL